MNNNNLLKIIPFFAVIAFLGIASGIFFFYQYTRTQAELNSIKSDPTALQKTSQEDAKKLIDEVGKLIELPTGEEPQIVTISDVTKLQDQPFFQKAKNGDKLLVYNNAHKAILYDPTLKKIVDVAPVGDSTASAQPQTATGSGIQH